MELSINYHEEEAEGELLTSNGFSISAWNSLTRIILTHQPDARVLNNQVIADWSAILPIIGQLSSLKGKYGFKVTFDELAKKYIQKYVSDYSAVRAVSGKLTVKLVANEIPKLLKMHCFTERELSKEQLRDLIKVVGLKHGANFSVPGAGKTTVALATHILTKNLETHLLVVAPKNAFGAWDDVIDECIAPEMREDWRFVRLTGGREAITAILSDPPLRVIISYDQFLRVSDLIARFLATSKVHMVCDESHRIKGGERSKKGNAILRLAHLPVRKDILSGTPLPNSILDISPQIDFLWPGQSLGKEIVKSKTPSTLLLPLYARTTKSELQLPPVERKFYKVPMSSAQHAFYGIVRSELLKRRVGIGTTGNIDLASARNSVIRLLQISSNPILAVRSLTENLFEKFDFQQAKLQVIFEKITQEWDSPKILEACRLARNIVSKGQKCVIWSNFKENVERIAVLLKDLGATFIHGDIDTGDENNPDTREWRIGQFHTSNLCNVLVANPAACSEGISLHKVCHHAIYVDRSYNAAHFLQSVDRIHRLGLSMESTTFIHILESVAPITMGSIDYSVRRRLIVKLNTMFSVLEDKDLQQLSIDEEEAGVPADPDISLDDIEDIITELSGTTKLQIDAEVM
ncbi:hypothetical protein J2T12_001013 [Paenibacillus anaericanus]|uniref:SNF2-related protein n=1 Tax=Paenibacillus anaericanus TaxID=170367 RepID=UPI00278416CC|nr:SNF2-related protein [Paenibacillus anaericanus]MDQ0087619.1 hypothetical protein [Paenibacillus anaericanus]